MGLTHELHASYEVLATTHQHTLKGGQIDRYPPVLGPATLKKVNDFWGNAFTEISKFRFFWSSSIASARIGDTKQLTDFLTAVRLQDGVPPVL